MNCITIQHCIVRQWAGEKAVSRYNYYIVTKAKRGQRLLVGWARQQARGHGAGRALGAARRGRTGARGAQAGARADAQGARQQAPQGRAAAGAAGAHGSRRGRGAGRAAWARGLATGCALGEHGLFSIRIDSVLFLSRFLDIVREPGS